MRHKRKLVISATVTGGCSILYGLVSWITAKLIFSAEILRRTQITLSDRLSGHYVYVTLERQCCMEPPREVAILATSWLAAEQVNDEWRVRKSRPERAEGISMLIGGGEVTLKIVIKFLIYNLFLYINPELWTSVNFNIITSINIVNNNAKVLLFFHLNKNNGIETYGVAV
jgi:hypothetical protein